MQIFATFGLLILSAERGAGGHRAAKAIASPSKVGALVIELGDIRITAAAAHHPGRGDGDRASRCMLFLQRTMTGKSIRAVTQDRQAARLMGINVERTFLVTFGIGAALAGLAGALLAPIYTLSPGIGGNFILAAFAVVVLGGPRQRCRRLYRRHDRRHGGGLRGLLHRPGAQAGDLVHDFPVVLVVRPSGLLGQVGRRGGRLP